MLNIKSPLTLELLKSTITAAVGAAALFFGQQWADNDLEYRTVSREAYLSSPLGEQGLSLYHDKKELKNISIVEFGIFNTTSRDFHDVNLIFTYKNVHDKHKLVSGGIITPTGIPQKDAIEEVPTKEENSKGFIIKFIPKQQDKEYFHAVFIFDGDTAPPMFVTSTTNAAAIVPYREWKDAIKAISFVAGVFALAIATTFFIGTLIDFIFAEKNHQKTVGKFKKHASSLKDPTYTPETIKASVKIYESFTKPKTSIFWGKIIKRNTDYLD
jgi:hypothetical protein